VHSLHIADDNVAKTDEGFTDLGGGLIDCVNTGEATARMQPYAILRVDIAHHVFSLCRVRLAEDVL